MEIHTSAINVLAVLSLASASVGVAATAKAIEVQPVEPERATLPAAYPEKKTRIHDPSGQLYQPDDEPLGGAKQPNRAQRRAELFGHVARTFDHRSGF